MFFTKLTIEDFGIFYGRQEVNLKRGLYVFKGPNGRGKTTVVNAVKWAFFGSFDDRQGRPVPPEVILNRDAEQDGRNSFLVEIEMTAGRKKYVLRRGCKIPSGQPPEPDLFLSVDGDTQTHDGAVARLEQLLNPRIARFFLFDGEELRKYEELLFGENEGADLIKESIEQILGLPILSNGQSDAAMVVDGFERRKDKLAKKEQKSAKFAAQAEQLSSDIESKQDDISDLKAQQVEITKVINSRDRFLQKYENSLDELKNIEAIESELSNLKDQREAAIADRTAALSSLYIDVLDRAVAGERDALVETAEKGQDQEATHRAMNATLDDGTCAICAHELEASEVTALSKRLKTLEAAIASNGSGVSVTQVLGLSAIAGTGSWGRVNELDKQIAEISGTEAAKREDLEARRAGLQKLPEDEVGQATRERDQAQQDLGALKQSIGSATEELSVLDQDLKSARKRIGELGASQEIQLLQAQVVLANQVQALFEASKSVYRKELKERIEADATEIFLSLRHEESFTALRINDRYGLEILNEKDEVVTGRSAGQEQVVALALIGALNRNAMREAPVVMDTPFGRLDPEHRENILNFVPEMAEQVFLLVHSGEVSDTDLGRIRGNVESVVELHRAAPDRTELRPEVG